MTRAVTRFARCSTARRSRAPHAGCLGPGHVSGRGFFASGFPSRRRSWGSAAGGMAPRTPDGTGPPCFPVGPGLALPCRRCHAGRGFRLAVSGGVELAGKFRKSGQKGYGLRRFECPWRFLVRVSPGRGWPEDASGLSGSVNRAVFGQFLGRKALATWSGGCCDLARRRFPVAPGALPPDPPAPPTPRPPGPPAPRPPGPPAPRPPDPPTPRPPDPPTPRPPLASPAFSFRGRPPNSRPSRKRRRGVRAGASRRAAIDSATRQAPRFVPSRKRALRLVPEIWPKTARFTRPERPGAPASHPRPGETCLRQRQAPSNPRKPHPFRPVSRNFFSAAVDLHVTCTGMLRGENEAASRRGAPSRGEEPDP